MPRFFAEEGSVSDGFITVRGSDAAHISYSLRMKTGEEITFCRAGTDYHCRIEKITPDEVICGIVGEAPSDCEPTVKMTLYQALPKSDKMEFIIQKTTELGIYSVVPFISKRCISRPDKASAEKKLRRWRKISEEAAKQSGRGIIPEISPIITFEEMLEKVSSDINFICYENGGKPLSDLGIDSKKSISVVIGAEGGFERSEAEAAAAAGIVPVWLGKRILRCETCPVAVTAAVMNMSGNF